jgi:hypothetical protein
MRDQLVYHPTTVSVLSTTVSVRSPTNMSFSCAVNVSGRVGQPVLVVDPVDSLDFHDFVRWPLQRCAWLHWAA